MTNPKLYYFINCVVFSLGASYFIRSGLGTDPLDVFCLGIHNKVGLSIGTTQSLFALVCLLIWCGYMIDLFRHNIPTFSSGYTNMIIGSILCLQGSAGIIYSGFGIRAMDLVSISVERITGIKFWITKAVFETALLTLGWYMGGPVGIGTITFLVVVGYLIQPCITINKFILDKSTSLW